MQADWFAAYAPLYRPRTAALIGEGQKVSQVELEEARAGREELRGDLEMRMDRAGIDVWISPAALGSAPAGLESTGDPIMNLPWTHAGLPTVTVPAGVAGSGLPLGLQISARFMHDERLLVWAEGIENALLGSPARR